MRYLMKLDRTMYHFQALEIIVLDTLNTSQEFCMFNILTLNGSKLFIEAATRQERRVSPARTPSSLRIRIRVVAPSNNNDSHVVSGPINQRKAPNCLLLRP